MYKNPVHLALVSLGLLENSILSGVWVAFTLDFAEAGKILQRRHMGGGYYSGC